MKSIPIENAKEQRGYHCWRICDPRETNLAKLPNVQPKAYHPVRLRKGPRDEV